MAKIIVTLDDSLIKVVPLSKERMTLGRRPYNDIVVDNLAVSGEHAALQAIGSEYYIEDLSSTNGIYINGKKIKRQILQTGDNIEIGKYTIKYVQEVQDVEGNKSSPSGIQSSAMDSLPSEERLNLFEQTKFADVYVAIKVLSGQSMGKEMPLVKVVTTIGKPGEAVIAITKRPKSYVVSHVEGASRPMLNGVAFGIDAVPLKNGDFFELAGTAMQFIEN
ncbi:MAG: FHA domain-containing protein [Burkholderiaceae bacterium]|nr:FHA domain-containing protein [Burkholderiaceae bacterium]